MTLSINSVSPEPGDTFNIYVSVEGFDSLSSGQFRLKWDPLIIRLDSVQMPVDTISNNSPFRNNANPDRITFLYENSDGVGADGSVPDGSKLLKLSFTAIGGSGDSTCIMIDPSGALEFIKLASEELSVTVITGCVHLQGVNALPSHEQQNLNCHWHSDEKLFVSHSPSLSSALIEVISLDGRMLASAIVAPQTDLTPITVSPELQRTLIAVRYTRLGLSYTRLIAGPR